MNIQEIKLYNPGILCADMPKTVFSELSDSCNLQIENKNISTSLKRNILVDFDVQGIEEMLPTSLPASYITFLSDFANEYVRYFDLKKQPNSVPKIVHKWLNLQKQHEYRPLHKHNDGSNGLSFVTYLSIPYLLEDEDSYPNHTKRAIKHRNGRIEFLYNTFTGDQKTSRLDIDKSYEGKTIIFINSLMHLVYPYYTSDEYRISLAGNINFV